MEDIVRERKGSFYTPKIWAELSQRYIADAFGEDWQDKYYIWDCAAGTGNLLIGLKNKYNVWASTLDDADIDEMRCNADFTVDLLGERIFQFDFLNDDFNKLPDGLLNIINNDEKRKKLIVYINPPYADASSNMKTLSKIGNSYTKVHELYAKDYLGSFARELFAQFLARIYHEIPNCKIALFSKLKLFSANHAKLMQTWFKARSLSGFIAPSDTFYNVRGKFPVSFQIWDTCEKAEITDCLFDVYNENAEFLQRKIVYNYNRYRKINDWIVQYKERCGVIGYLSRGRNDFQNKRLVFIINAREKATNSFISVNRNNLIPSVIYYAVQNIPKASWLNDRDQFLYPESGWSADFEFQYDCLVYALFRNNVQSCYGVNHWIPFSEEEVGFCGKFASNFMSGFLSSIKMDMSESAQDVLSAGRALWRYYFQQKDCDSNAGLCDIRGFFQGKANSRSLDAGYNDLMRRLRAERRSLASKIKTKIYEHGFLKR